MDRFPWLKDDDLCHVKHKLNYRKFLCDFEVTSAIRVWNVDMP